MNRGYALGAAFDGATSEAERRARERLRAEERAAIDTDERNAGLRRIILEGLLLACLVTIIAMLLVR
jgi:hypothetical protein